MERGTVEDTKDREGAAAETRGRCGWKADTHKMRFQVKTAKEKQARVRLMIIGTGSGKDPLTRSTFARFVAAFNVVCFAVR